MLKNDDLHQAFSIGLAIFANMAHSLLLFSVPKRCFTLNCHAQQFDLSSGAWHSQGTPLHFSLTNLPGHAGKNHLSPLGVVPTPLVLVELTKLPIVSPSGLTQYLLHPGWWISAEASHQLLGNAEPLAYSVYLP